MPATAPFANPLAIVWATAGVLACTTGSPKPEPFVPTAYRPVRRPGLRNAQLAERGKRVAGGVSVDLTALRGSGKVLNPG